MKKKTGKFLVSFISVAGIQLLLVVIKLLPEKLLYSLGNCLSRSYFYLAGKNRTIALRNLAAVFYDAAPATLYVIAKESFNTMGRIVLDTLRYKDFPADKLRSLIRIEGIENLESALKKGKGAIVVSAHLGSFTLVGTRLSIDGYKAAFVARHARNKKIEQIIMRFCRNVGQKIIFSRPIITCMRRCITVLSRNEVLIIEMDQNFGTEGVPINFFGHPAMVATGPIRLSLMTDAPIVPIFIVRNADGTHVIHIEPPFECCRKGEEDDDVRDNLQGVICIVERYIRQYPGQWVNWIHKQWDITGGIR
ncbi:MAG: lysophospholipid acyltransferase family protein [Candidatus Omnitrophica bacterium]|nr:lysophospholipid acyltransferase family protein [Candidatus Omnitrophota bacterium]